MGSLQSNGWVQRMMMAPSSTPKTTITPPSSSPTIVGSKPMVSQNQDRQQTPPPPPPLGPLKCPRCDSSNTKFCYYNNYSLSQPRHFCKACKRYWTRGGTLRNVPVGGGSRKNKRVNKKHNNARAETPPTSIATRNPNPNNPLINLPTTSSSELNSLIYASFSTSAAPYDGNNNNMGGLVIPSNQLSSGLINHHQASTNFLTNEYPSYKFGSQDAASLLQQDCINANLGLKDVKVEGIESINAMGNDINGDGVHLWQTNYPFDQSLNVDSTYMYWNPPIGYTFWPDAAANSSVAPLI